MKKLFILSALLCTLYSCKNKNDAKAEEKKEEKGESPADTLLITENSWGLINANSDIDYLKKTFGEANVKDESICGPECVDTIDVTTIYPNTIKAVTVYWDDSAYHKRVGRVEAETEGSPYHTAAGLKLGSTLADIQKVYPGKISFSGFGWDYGGYIGSASDSAFMKSNLGFGLDYKQHPADEGLYGDRELNTDMPLVKKNMDKIVIVSLSLAFPQ